MTNDSTQWSVEIHDRLINIAEKTLDDLWDNAMDYGLWIRQSDVPEPEADNLIDHGFVEDENRIAELEAGDSPTADEVEEFRQWWVERQLEGDCDHDQIPGYGISKVHDQYGNEGVALVLRTGYSFTGIEQWLEGIFRTADDARAFMSQDGWIS